MQSIHNMHAILLVFGEKGQRTTYVTVKLVNEDFSNKSTNMIVKHYRKHVHRTAYMTVELVNEGLSPVVHLHALVSPCKGASHAVVDDHKVLVPLQQGRACTEAHTFSLKDTLMATNYMRIEQIDNVSNLNISNRTSHIQFEGHAHGKHLLLFTCDLSKLTL